MKLLTFVIGLTLLAENVWAQRRQAQYNCVTPEPYYGQCVTLTYCPQVANVLRPPIRRGAQEYLLQLQRSCGTRSVNGDPVVCCTRPQTNIRPTAAPPVQPTVAPTTPRNPFFPTASVVDPTTTIRNTRNPQNPFLTTEAPAPTEPSSAAPLIEPKAGYCRGPDTREGSCTAIKSCDILLAELDSRRSDPTFADFLRGSNKICGGGGTLVCCPSSAPLVSTTESPIKNLNSNEIPRRLPRVQEGCGYTKNIYKKIVGGEVSKKGAWPWIALIGYDDELSSSPFKCGGALVTARHVITAAHCVLRTLSFVRLGEHDLRTDTETRHVDVKVVRIEAHPEYNKRNGRNDIAILYLASNVHFTDLISPICLPTTPELLSKSYVDHRPFVVGWGKTVEGGKSAEVLQELQIPVFSNDVCVESYRNENRLITRDQFEDGVLCAGVLSGGHDTCQGDSGGPLMIPEPYQNDVRYYLIGVVSYGIGCARPNIPGVYTSTQYMIDWISTKIADTP